MIRKDGPFKSLEDFYDRANKRVVNVKVITNLILSGAFNKLEGSIEECFDKLIELRGKDKVHRQFYCLLCKARFPCTVKENEEGDTECPNCSGSDIIFGNEKCKGKKFNEFFISSQVFGFASGENPLKK